MSRNFALIGAAGYIAPRHLQAIRETGNHLVAAADPHDSVGVLDRFGFDVKFFTEIERFDRHLEKLRRAANADQSRVHYVSVCSPNYLHDAHCRLALRVGADAICEKPLVINPWNLDPLRELESETGRRIWTVLQLRVHPQLVALHERLRSEGTSTAHDVVLTYITPRGAWYHTSWKGAEDRSGGVATNIGIHLFDLLIWLFGRPQGCRLHLGDDRRMAGFLELERARVRWFLSVHPDDRPSDGGPSPRTHRAIEIDGELLEFSEGFTDLHTRVYEGVLAGQGFGIDEARPSLELVHQIRHTSVTGAEALGHPFLLNARRHQ